MVRAFDGELADRPEFIVLRVFPVHQPDEVPTGFAILLILDVHAVG